MAVVALAMDGDARTEIARLEARIERLAVSAERCRKIAAVAKVAIGLGLLLLGAIVFGPLELTALSLMITAILTLGGIVLAGSNETTARETAEKIAQAERDRAALIGAIDLQLVPDGQRVLH